MSHWSVDDESTSILMNTFYKNLGSGKSKSSSLREAKLAFIKHPDNPYANPIYWGGFVLMGDDQPMSNDEVFNWWPLALLILGFLLVVGFVKRGSMIKLKLFDRKSIQ